MTFRERWYRLVALLRRRTLDRELDDEIAAHVDMATAEQVARGVEPVEARRRALAALGGRNAAKATHRDARGMPSLDAFVSDVRYAIRSLRRSPTFSVTVIVTLAIGIGLNTAVFSVANGVLFKGFSFVPDGNRIVYLRSERSDTGQSVRLSYADFSYWRTRSNTFTDMAAYGPGIPVSLSGDVGFPESQYLSPVSANAFSLLQITPALGRDFRPSDAQPGAPRVAIISCELWQTRYGRDPEVVGRTIRINGVPTTVVGVLPHGSAFLPGWALWVPLTSPTTREQTSARPIWFAFARLAEGATIADARAEMAVIGQRPGGADQLSARLHPVVTNFVEEWSGPRLIARFGSMWAGVLCLQALLCAMLASLVLSRGRERSRELALRLALGSGPWHIVRLLVGETIMLSTVGAIGGLCIASWSIEVYAAAAYPSPFRSWDFSVDGRALAYLIGLSTGTGLLLGLAPAVRLSTARVDIALRNGARGTLGLAPGPLRSSVLLAAQVAVAVVLLTAAGVSTRSLLFVHMADTGISTTDVLAGRVVLPPNRYRTEDEQSELFRRLTTGLRAVPGVDVVSMTNRLPMQGATSLPYESPGMATSEPQHRPVVSAVRITADYFSTVGATIVSGRDFTSTDTAVRAPTVLVNQRFAQSQWPAENPVGKQLRVFDGPGPAPWRTVVGVVSDIIQQGLSPGLLDRYRWQGQSEPLIYLPFDGGRGRWVLIRTRVPPAGLVPSVRRLVQSLDSDLPVDSLGPLSEQAPLSTAAVDTDAALFLTFALIAALLAAIGVYAMAANSVSSRSGELGVRIAMGATRRDVVILTLRQTCRAAGIGLVVGSLAALAIMPALRSMLVHVPPVDPIAFGGALFVMLGAALLGCLIPAYRASRVDPVAALREQA